MATNIADIAVRVGADIEPLQQGMKKARKSVSDISKEVRSSANELVKWGAAASAAAAAAGAAVFAASAQSAKELTNLSKIAGTSVEQFQKLAFGAQKYGVEQDKLADILKDTQDKIGDFIQNGAGPMADFFANIGPKVGVTAEHFKNLSGPQALQLYVDSLEKANLSQSDMTFYMEAIASDATLLLPLLENSGAAMNKFANEADKLGIVLSDIEVEKLNQSNVAIGTITKTIGAMGQKISAQLAPVFTALADQFKNFVADSNAVGRATDATFNFIISGASLVADAIRGIQVVIKSLEVAFKGLEVAAAYVLDSILTEADKMANVFKTVINEIIDGANKIPGVDIERLVIGESAATQKIREWRTSATEELTAAVDEWHNLMMEPLPSEGLKAWSDNVIAIAEETAAKTVDATRAGVKAQQAVIDQGYQKWGDADVKAQESALSGWSDHYSDQSAQTQMFLKMEREQRATNQKIIAQEMGNALSNLTTLMESENKRMFEIGKAAAISQAVIDTYASAQSAFKALAGIPVVGPALGAAAAGAAIAAGMARVSAISSRSFSTAGGGGDPGAAAQSASVAASAPAAQGPQQTLRVEQVDPGSMVTGETLNRLMEQIVELQEDGYRLMV